MSLKYVEKFLVINQKHIKKLNLRADKNFFDLPLHSAVEELIEAIKKFNYSYLQEFNKDLDNKYYVCNQDEPYAQKVMNIILEGEADKIVGNNEK